MRPLGIVVIALAILISVIIHEGGHFFTAKLFGMKATKFFVGFGPTLFSRRRGETEYGLKAIPAGGFVTIIGMTPLEEVAPEDEARAFFRQPTPQRVTVLAAGSATHLIIAVLLATGVAFLTPVAKPGVVIGQISPCVPVTETAGADPSTALVNGVCPAGQVASPAAAFGLRAGDVITAIGGKKVTSDDPEDQLTKLIRTSTSAATTLTVTRRSPATHKLLTGTVPVTLAAVKRDRATGAAGNQDAFALGVSFTADAPGYLSPSASQGAHLEKQYLGVNSQSVLFGAFYAVGSLGHSASQLFNHNRASDSGAQITSVVGVAEVGGDIFADKSLPFSVQLGNILLIIAAVNASLGILNLLPLLPFDGGHIAITLAERVFRRKRVKMDIGKRIQNYYLKIAPVMYVFSVVIIVFSLVVVVADFKNPVA